MAALLLSMLRASVLTEVSQLQKWVPKVPFGTPALRAVHSDDWRYDLSWGFMLHSVSMATLALGSTPGQAGILQSSYLAALGQTLCWVYKEIPIALAKKKCENHI